MFLSNIKWGEFTSLHRKVESVIVPMYCGRRVMRTTISVNSSFFKTIGPSISLNNAILPRLSSGEPHA
jgi:hypothetical protein